VRSYDPIVRFGGDEFVCGLSDTDLDGARRRFDEIRAAIRQSDAPGSISVGLAALGPSDSLEELIARGDAALYRGKQEKPGGVPA
jgi:diguanylate cyclase (GGDEF)-like protein